MARRWVFFALLVFLVPDFAAAASTADHAKFKQLQQTFKSGPDVTRACLSCHTEAEHQVKQTTHWRWEYDVPSTGQTLGKRHVLNNFCGATASNEPWCTSCHIGYGWDDVRQPPKDDLTVDCLICHDTTGIYAKGTGKAGHPSDDSIPRLGEIARKVGPTSRRNCGNCHFNGGGAPGAKHGDLDGSLIDPSFYVDVHMDEMGLNFTCSTCHRGDAHMVRGSRYETTARDRHGIDIPGRTDASRASCESCHGFTPHERPKLNHHVARVACQTCHIPEVARGGLPTKTWWDWSTAGGRDAEGEPMSVIDPRGYEVYSGKKGDFSWERDVAPEYRWFNGEVAYTMPSTIVADDVRPVPINILSGGPADRSSRIWPFKVMRGRQPFDPINRTLLINHIAGEDDTGFWKNLDYGKSLAAGTAYAGQPFSGEHIFVDTVMHWPLIHMVAPRENALECQECHSRQGRLNGLPGVHIPGRDFHPLQDWAGLSLISVVAAGVFGHGLARVIMWARRRRGGGDA